MGYKSAAIALFDGSFSRSYPTEQSDPQTIADDIASASDGNGEYPQTILIVTAGGFGDAPIFQKRYEKGQDFSSHVGNMDTIAGIISDWIKDIEDPNKLAELLIQVTGAVGVRVIERSETDALIGYDLP